MLEASETLQNLVAEKQQFLERTFQVAFAQDNEPVERSIVGGNPGPIVYARQARLDELFGIESALFKSQPSHLEANSHRGVKFYFLKQELTDEVQAHASYQPDKDGRAAIYFWPAGTLHAPITEGDIESYEQDADSIEFLTMHELAHNSQSTIGEIDFARLEQFMRRGDKADLTRIARKPAIKMLP